MTYRTYPNSGDPAPLGAEYVTAVDDPNLPNDKVAVGVDPIDVNVVGDEIRISADLPFTSGISDEITTTASVLTTSPSSHTCTAAAPYTITLFDPVGDSVDGKEQIFKRNDATLNEITFAVSGGGTVEGQTDLCLIGLNNTMHFKVVQSAWRLVGWYRGSDSLELSTNTAIKPGYPKSLFVDCTAGNVELTLPSGSSAFLQEYDLIKIDSSINKIQLPDTISGIADREIVDQHVSMTVKNNHLSGGWYIK